MRNADPTNHMTDARYLDGEEDDAGQPRGASYGFSFALSGSPLMPEL